MVNVKITNMVKFYTLILLYHGPKHGYELIKELEDKLERKISASNIYPFLNSLKKNKLIEFKKVEERDKKVYHLTSDGRKFAKKIFNRTGDLIEIALRPRLTICAHCGCKVFGGGYSEKINGRELKFCCSHCAKSYINCK
jgi:DNA-binding PadR family transcriptional regulator